MIYINDNPRIHCADRAIVDTQGATEASLVAMEKCLASHGYKTQRATTEENFMWGGESVPTKIRTEASFAAMRAVGPFDSEHYDCSTPEHEIIRRQQLRQQRLGTT